MSQNEFKGSSPETSARNELAAKRQRLAQAQQRLAAVEAREVGKLHSDRVSWERDHATAKREVADATRSLHAAES